MVEGVALVCKHNLSIDKGLIIVLVVKRGCSWSTSANRKVRLHTADEKVLLTAVNKKALELAFSHSGSAVLHHAHM